MNDFLKLEYEQCLALLKHYDDRYLELIKFASGLSTGVLSLVVGLRQLKPESPTPWTLVALLSAITCLVLGSLFVAMIQNRLYFVYPARQVNALRAAMLDGVGDLFRDNQMYTDPSFSAFQWRSAHSLLNAIICLQIGAFLGLTIYALMMPRTNPSIPLGAGVVSGLVFSGCVFVGSAVYLVGKGALPADEAVHPLRHGAR